ncbi:aldo/keto reductase [bacterium]|nr:aldo/keto reductase [bacterium]
MDISKRALGNTGLMVSPLGFGGAELGFQDHAGAAAIARLLNQALDAGLNVIDTASAYKESEALIGQAVSHRRSDFYLFTKCGATDGFTRADWSKTGIQAQLESSLRLMQTDYVDLLQLHSCDIETLRRGEAIEALQDARRAGKVRFVGYSGDGESAHTALSLDVFDTLQTSISVADQQPLSLTLPVAASKGVGVIAKRPVANAAWRTGQLPTDSYHHAYFERLQALRYPFLSLPLEHAVIEALAFTLSQPAVAVAIVGTVKPGRFEQNLRDLAAFSFPPNELEAIRARWLEVADSTWVGQV